MLLKRSAHDAIFAHAYHSAPIEACGYLAEQDGVHLEAVPLRNADASPEHFSFVPEEQFAAVKAARAKGQRLSAVYHSHPASPARLSQEDLRLANDPSALYLICSLSDEVVKAFRVSAEKQVTEEAIELV